MAVTLNTHTPSEGGDAAPEGHDAAMAAKAEAAAQAAAQGETPPTPERPSWLPEKFQSGEDLAKAYAELQKKLGGAAPEPSKPEATPPTGDTPSEDAAAKAVESAGLDMAKLQAEFAEKGELSTESLAGLEKAGITKAMVDDYVAGQQARADKLTATVHEAAGGAERFNEVRTWAAENMSTAEREAFNAALAQGPEAATMAVQGLVVRFEREFGSDTSNLATGKTSGSRDADAFQSWKQVTEAMRDPRYTTDPAYRADVERRLGASKI